MKVFEREIARFAPAERQEVMELKTGWELTEEHRGTERMAMRQIRKRFGIVTEEMAARLSHLSAEQLDELGEALFDFTSLADLEQWLAQH